MAFVLRLNKYILVPILSEWLTIFDFIHLENAATNQVFSVLLRNFCAQYPNLFQYTSSTAPYSHDYITWIRKRQQNLVNLNLKHGFVDRSEIIMNFSMLLEIHSSVALPSRMVLPIVITCRKLRCFDAALINPKEYFYLAFHGSQQFNKLYVSGGLTYFCQATSIVKLLTSMLHYRGGQSLTHLKFDVKFDQLLSNVNFALEMSSICPKLKELSLCCTDEIINPSLLTYVACFPMLERFSLDGCQGFAADTFYDLFSESVPLISLSTFSSPKISDILQINRYSIIETLDLKDWYLNDECMQVFGTFCPSVTSLNVSGCSDITEQGLKCVLMNGQLKQLHLVGTNLWTVVTAINICSLCKLLEHLNIYGIKVNAADIELLLEYCVYLRRLITRKKDWAGSIADELKLKLLYL